MEPDSVRILLVEDNPGDVRLVREMLKNHLSPSFILAHAGCLSEALKMAQEETFAAVLLDLNLPDARGMEAVETLVRRAPELPVIVQTSLDDEEAGLSALRAGADDYLVKGRIDERVLIRIIRYTLERRRTREELRKASTDLEAVNASLRASRTAALNLLEDAEQARRKAEEASQALRENEATLRGILDATQESIWLFSPEGRALAGNETAFQRFGRSAEEIVGKHMDEFLTPELAASRGARLREVADTGRPVEFEDERAGILFRHSFYPVRDGRGLVVSIAIFSRDITQSEREARDRERLLAMLQERNAEMEAVFSSIQDAVLVYDHRMNVARVNPMFIPTFGFDPVGLNVRDILKQTHCRNLDGSPLILEDQPTPRALRGEMVRNRRFRITLPDQSEMALETSSSPLRVDERVMGSVTVWHDITDRLRDEEALRESGERFRIALENSAITVATLDTDLRYTWIYNPRHAFKPEQVIGKRPDQLTDPAEVEELIAVLRRVSATGITERKTISGGFHGDPWVYDISAEPWKDETGRVIGLAFAILDITERTRMEKAVQELEKFKLQERSQRTWQHTFDGIADLISIHAKDGRILRGNRAFLDFFGLDDGTVSQKMCFELFHADGRMHTTCPMMRTWATGQPASLEVSDTRSGKVFDVSTYPYTTPEGTVEGCIHIARDVTDRKQSEMQLIMNERLAALGQMAAGIAHEINNPLATISGCAEGLLNRTQKGQMESALFSEYLVIIGEEIARCKAITSSMLSFVRKGDPQKQALDVHEVLDRTLELVGFQGRLRNVDVLKDYTASGTSVSASEVELKQVFVALLSNALDAMGDAGNLTITTRREDAATMIRIGDSGPGIPAEIAERIFDPFFSTKLSTGGTGLGLAIARRIVESLGGTLTLEESSPAGAAFGIRLPSAKEKGGGE